MADWASKVEKKLLRGGWKLSQAGRGDEGVVVADTRRVYPDCVIWIHVPAPGNVATLVAGRRARKVKYPGGIPTTEQARKFLIKKKQLFNFEGDPITKSVGGKVAENVLRALKADTSASSDAEGVIADVKGKGWSRARRQKVGGSVLVNSETRTVKVDGDAYEMYLHAAPGRGGGPYEFTLSYRMAGGRWPWRHGDVGSGAISPQRAESIVKRGAKKRRRGSLAR